MFVINLTDNAWDDRNYKTRKGVESRRKSLQESYPEKEWVIDERDITEAEFDREDEELWGSFN